MQSENNSICKLAITSREELQTNYQNMHQRQRRTKRSKEAFTATTKSRRRPDSTRKRRGTGKKKGFVEKWRVVGYIPQTGDRRDKGKQSHYDIKLQRIWPCRKLKQKWEKISPFATESENSQACPKLGRTQSNLNKLEPWRQKDARHSGSSHKSYQDIMPGDS